MSLSIIINVTPDTTKKEIEIEIKGGEKKKEKKRRSK